MLSLTLASFPRFGTGIGLRRVDFLLSALGIDRDWLGAAAIAVTGSNGKGSTALYCSEISRSHGFRTGLFTSPHLYRLEERIKIDGQNVSTEEFEQSLQKVQAAAVKFAEKFPYQQFGAFELIFAAAVYIFFQHRCEVCVYEAGIGGRYDPVRLAQAEVAAVASVDLEHTALLGDTLELICLDKVDICRSGGTVFFGENCAPLISSVAAYCVLQGLTPVHVGKDIALDVTSISKDATQFEVKCRDEPAMVFVTPLIGRHQANNAALAILLFRRWLQLRSPGAFSVDLARQALSSAHWPGRLEAVSSSPLIVIDVGHTPDGVRAALSGLQAAYQQEKFVLVLGVSADKDAETIVSLLAPHFDCVICTQAYHKGRPAQEIAELAMRARGDAKVLIAQDIAAAHRLAVSTAVSEHCAVYAAGGMYLAAEFAQYVRGQNPRMIPYL